MRVCLLQEEKTMWKEIVKAFPYPPKSVFGSFESTIIKDRITGITAWFGQVLSTPGLKDCFGLSPAVLIRNPDAFE